MLMTAAGTVKPARVVIMGARRSGSASDCHSKTFRCHRLKPRTCVQLPKIRLILGGKWLDVPMSAERAAKAADAAKNGYGWMPGEEYIRDQAPIFDKAVSNADIVITTALLPGRDAPRLIRAGTVAKMKPGSVILDMAVESGGYVGRFEMWRNSSIPTMASKFLAFQIFRRLYQLKPLLYTLVTYLTSLKHYLMQIRILS